MEVHRPSVMPGSLLGLVLFLASGAAALAQHQMFDDGSSAGLANLEEVDAHTSVRLSGVEECLASEGAPLDFSTLSGSGPHWSDTLSIFAGLDGSKQPQDVGVNANFGGRTALNLGIPLWEEFGLGLQVGTAFAYSDNAVQVLAAVDGADDRVQSFTTVGVFQRPNDTFEWALAWDFLYEESYDQITLNQLRGRAAWATGEFDKFGGWGTWSGDENTSVVGGTQVRLRPIDQVSLFWNHIWQSGVETEVWGGVALGHGEVVHVFPGNPGINTAPLFGAMLHVPLNDRVALYGQGNFILPADSGTVDSYLGVVIYLDKARPARYSRYSPMLDVAASTSFAVDLRR